MFATELFSVAASRLFASDDPALPRTKKEAAVHTSRTVEPARKLNNAFKANHRSLQNQHVSQQLRRLKGYPCEQNP
jgi:hypothetical protein